MTEKYFPCIHCRSCAQNEKGFALITVLIIMVIISILLSGMVYRQSLMIQRSSAIIHQSQAFSVEWGLEHWVKTGLALDAKETKIDSLDELWARPLTAVPFAGGQVSGQLIDQQAKLNINNLVLTSGDTQKKWQIVFARYLSHKHLPNQLLDVIIDWMDENHDPLQNGAESDYYLTLTPPYRSGDQILVITDTLKLMKGISTEYFHIMKPDISALPAATKININTASKDVLLALSDEMTAQISQAWINYRKAVPAQSAKDFNSFLQKQGVTTPVPNDLITVSTDYFLLKDHIQYGESTLSMNAIFSRSANKTVNLLQRWIAPSEDS